MRWVIWGFLLLSCSLLTAASLDINEIMYNPSGDDNNREFVEIYSTESLNFTGYIIGDLNSDDTLELLSYVPGEFSLIVEEGFNYSGIGASVYSAGAAIGNNLGNDGDTVSFYYPNGTLIDSVAYDSSLANNNSKTVERRSDGSWGESLVDGGTPGRENSIWGLSAEYSVLEITEVLPSPFSADDATKPGGEWVELYNSGDRGIDLLSLQLKDEHDDNELFIADSNTFGGTIICAGCYKVVYRDGDSGFALNNDFDQVRLLVGDELVDQMSYTSSTEGMSISKVQDNWFHTAPTPGEENVYREQCDWSISVEANTSISTPDDFSFMIRVSRAYGFPAPITVRGQIEDFFGEVVKEYRPWTAEQVTTTVSKEYSPRLAEGVFQLSFWLLNQSCSDAVSANNRADRLVAINPVYRKANSSLAIEQLYLGSDDAVEWGDQFTAKVRIYKGASTQQAVELYAEKGGDKASTVTKITLPDQYQEYVLTLPVQVKSNCDEDLDDGAATVVLGGLGLRTEQPLQIKGIDKEVCAASAISGEKEVSTSRTAIQLQEYPLVVQPGGIIPLNVQVLNEDEEHRYTIWGYVYRGNKCYSCSEGKQEREANPQTILLQPLEAKVVQLFMKLDSAMEEGEYKVKVNVRKDEQKTAKESIGFLYVQPVAENKSLAVPAVVQGIAQEEFSVPELSSSRLPASGGIVVYESSTEKASQLILPFLLVAVVLLIIILVRK